MKTGATPRPNDATKLLLDRIISWEKDLSQYESLESILRDQFIILDWKDLTDVPKPLHDKIIKAVNNYDRLVEALDQIDTWLHDTDELHESEALKLIYKSRELSRSLLKELKP